MLNNYKRNTFYKVNIIQTLESSIKESTKLLIRQILHWEKRLGKNVTENRKLNYHLRIREFKEIYNSNDKHMIENKLAGILRNDIFLFFIIINEFSILRFLESGVIKEEGKMVAAKLFCDQESFYRGIKLCEILNFSVVELKTIILRTAKNLFNLNLLKDKNKLESLKIIHRLADYFKIQINEVNKFLKI